MLSSPHVDAMVAHALRSGAPAYLLLTRGPVVVAPLARGPFSLAEGTVVIGRSSICDVVLEDGSVSKVHAYLDQGPAGWTLEDAGSSTGSSIDGVALTARQKAPLPDGATVRIGEVEATFLSARSLEEFRHVPVQIFAPHHRPAGPDGGLGSGEHGGQSAV